MKLKKFYILLFLSICLATNSSKFLIPMAVSLGFGVLFSTFVTLILVPCTYVTVENIKLRLIKK